MKEAKWREFEKDEIEQIARGSYSYASLARNLGYSDEGGGSIATIKAMIEELDIDVSHFTGQGWFCLAKHMIVANMFLLKNI